MYRKLRIRMALSSFAVLLLLFLGTIGVVYLTSYQETLRADREMLLLYARAYWENGNPEEAGQLPPPLPGGMSAGPAAPAGGQFYSVELDRDGTAVSVNNPGAPTVSEDDLKALAARVAGKGQDGTDGPWVYHREENGGHTLVTLLDNTLVSESSVRLFTNTLRYGGLMVILLCAVIWFTSGLLVRPLEQNEQEQRRFLSDAGHELKTPVSVIATNAELLRREIGENRWLTNILAENGRSGELIQSLLTLTRLQEKESKQERICLSRIVESVILPFEGVAFEKGHVLLTEIRPETRVLGNEQQLSSLISILMDNVVRYSTEGTEIRVRLTEENHRAMLRVQNQCPEMSGEQCRRLFDRFYRADPSRTGEGHYGLGLSIARRIMETHRGEIHAEWQGGQITFTAVFPPDKA
ncbi:MAG: HAMP domain-containing histidine kinase [Clostridia bacterium]|nr:HAMP domain-containing histidine kinase [Clostridia bacterium]